MSDIEFISGLIAKAPNENAPEFVKASLSIKREELIAWLQGRSDEWVNADVKESRGGKWYVAVNERRPRGEGKPRRQERGNTTPANDHFPDDDLPF